MPLYAACLGDLGPGDFVVVECGACRHDELIHPAALLAKRSDPEGLSSLGLRLALRAVASPALRKFTR